MDVINMIIELILDAFYKSEFGYVVAFWIFIPTQYEQVPRRKPSYHHLIFL